MLTSSQVVEAVIAHMAWPENMNQKFMRIASPPCGARLANWDLDTALAWMDDNLGDVEQTRAAARYMIEAVRPHAAAPSFPAPPACNPRRSKPQPIDALVAQPASLFGFRTGLKQLQAVFPRHFRFFFERNPLGAMPILLSRLNRLLLTAKGRLCTTLAQRLLCAPGQFVGDYIRLGSSVLRRVYAFHDLSGSALLQRVGDRNKALQFAALLWDRLPGKSYRLLYTWSRHGRSAASFHQHCDNQVCARAFARAAAARLTAGAGAHTRHHALHHRLHVRRLCKRAVANCVCPIHQRSGMLPLSGRKSSRRRPHLLRLQRPRTRYDGRK